MIEKLDIALLPPTSNFDLERLGRPKHLTLEQFEALEVSPEELRIREQIYELEALLHSYEGSFVDTEQEAHGLKLVHKFVNGLYYRELTIPPGQVIMGKRHAQEHIVMLTAGSCIVVTERGRETITAPATFISPAGEKRVVITGLESVTWVVIHPTTETDIDKIEQEVIIAEPQRAAYYQQLREQAKRNCLLNTASICTKEISMKNNTQSEVA